MNKKYILFFLFGLLSITISAQSLAEAKALYEKGEYEEAKPAFKKLVKTQPGNGNYNLWYGVCCLETGEPAEALKHLESAVKRRVPSGQLYLARAYNDLYRFEDAIETYETYISDLRKRKRSTEEAEQLLEKSKFNLRMLKGVEEVCFIDSFVVDKENSWMHTKSAPNRASCSCTTPTSMIPVRKAERYTKRSWAISYIIAKCNRTAPSVSFRATSCWTNGVMAACCPEASTRP